MELVRDDIEQIIKSNLKSNDFEFISCNSVNSDDKSVGYLSTQDKICITYKTHDRIETFNVFIKKLPQSEYHRNIIIELGGFQRESLVFGEILADFQEYSIPIPKCYLARSDIIVLEDLSCDGYRNRSVFEPLDLPHAEKVLEALAGLHAATFIIEKRKGSKLNKIYPAIETEVLLNPDLNGKRCCMTGIKAIKKVAEKYLPNYSNDVTEKAFVFMENIFYTLKSSSVYPNVLSHSDIWNSNIMFKYEERGNLECACILDFQMATYKPPTHDIQLFLHTCTTKAFRERYYNQLLKHYFNCLSKQLLQAGIELNNIMSWDDFEHMNVETKPNVLVIASIYLIFVLMPSYVVGEVFVNDEKFKEYYEEDRTKYVLQAMDENETFRERNLESLKELFDYIKTT